MIPFSNLLNSVLPLAQRAAWERLGDRFSGEHAQFRWADLLGFFGVALAAAALIAGLRWLQLAQERRRRSNEPRHLFADLCDLHQLNRRDRRRLRELAAAHQLDSAGALFVRPDYFAAERLPEELAGEQEHYARIAQRLFAGLPEVEAAIDAAEKRPAAPASPVVSTLPSIGSGAANDAQPAVR